MNAPQIVPLTGEILAPKELPLSSQPQMDMALARLREGAKRFVGLTLDQRITLLTSMQKGLLHEAPEMVKAGCAAKHIELGTPLESEEWGTGPWGVVRQLRLLRESLQALVIQGNTPIGQVGKTVDGNLAVRVFPNNAIDGMLFKDVTVDVYMQPGVTLEQLEAERAHFYKKPDHTGRVVLVLGAGNIAAIGMMDVLTKMFNEGKVCLLKMNPVNAYLGPYIERAFVSAVQAGFLAIVYGGEMEGRYLTYHAGIDEIHLTGSERTHDAIVWGPAGAQREERMRRGDPLLKKPITSELGNISPVIVVPGPYSTAALRFQAQAVASAMTMNASFLCNSAKILVTPKGWKVDFMQQVQEECASIEPRHAYYPGAVTHWRDLIKGRQMVKHRGAPQDDALPWTFIRGLRPEETHERLFREEPFCSILSEAQVGSSDPLRFLEEAVDFVNERLWGTLCATLIVHPKLMADPHTRLAVERAISRLRYGTVAVNTFPGLAFVFASAPWGGYPGATPQDIQSGSGFVHNTSMLEGIEKSVIRAPLIVFPKPPFLPGHKTAHGVTRRMVALEENASWAKVPGIVWTAMRG
jgi:aldehyde dehydrogenase (NAD(P)+)